MEVAQRNLEIAYFNTGYYERRVTELKERLRLDPSNRAAIRSYTRTGFRILPGSPWAPEIEMVIDLAKAEAQPESAEGRITEPEPARP